MAEIADKAQEEQKGGHPILSIWWKIVDYKIGVVPLPIFIGIFPLIAALIERGKLNSDILTNIAILAVGGFACGEIGKRLPLLKHVGAAAILATFVPSYLVYAHILPVPIIKSVTSFTKESNFLYLFISSIIVGSILGMDRHVLIAGFLKIFVPLVAGSVVATGVGIGVGAAFGMAPSHTFFFIVAPIMAGGVGEGAIPLSIGYASILHTQQGPLFAQVLPPVMLGSLYAIIFAGLLNFAGKRYPHLTGEGRLQEGGEDLIVKKAPAAAPDIVTVAGALVTTVTLYLLGVWTQQMWGWPAPVVMLFAVVVIKLAHLATPSLQQGAFTVYRFFSIAVTYPLLFAIGVAMTPWDKLTAALSVGTFVTIFATVVTIMTVAFFTGRLLGMYPIDTAIVTACHSGQGGTGDVAILTAGNRMALMPFAQVATRIGGAIMVVITLVLMSHFASL